MKCLNCGHDVYSHFALGTLCKEDGCNCPRTQNEVIAENKAQEVELLRAACKNAFEWLTRATFDYSNGNTDSTGTIDEGEVYGWRGHKDVVDKLAAALGLEQE